MGKPGFPIPLLEGCARPNPPTGWGMGKPGFPIPLREGEALRGRGMGKPGFPIPLREGEALPRMGVWGNPVSPPPCSRAAPAQTLPPGGGMGKPGFLSPLLEGCARPNPPTGWGDGGTRFPHTPRRELMFTLEAYHDDR